MIRQATCIAAVFIVTLVYWESRSPKGLKGSDVNTRYGASRCRSGWWLIFLSVLALLVCLFYVYAFVYLAPYPGFDYLNFDWSISGFEPCEADVVWCEANRNSLQVGDRLLVVGDLTRAEWEQDWSQAPFAGYDAGEWVSITFRRGEEEQTINWQMLGPTGAGRIHRLPQGLLSWVPFWLGGTFVLIFVWPRDLRWWLLISFNYLTASWLAAGVCSSVGVAFASPAQHALAWLLVPVYLQLHLNVPGPLLRCRRCYLMPLLYAAAAVLALLELLRLLPRVAFNLALLLAFLGCLGPLIFRLFDRRRASDRPAVRLMLAGVVLAGAPAGLLSAVPALLGVSHLAGLPSFISLLALPLLLPLYVYAIYKRQLGPLELRANRLLSLYSFVLLSVTAFLLVFFAGGQWLGISHSSLVFSLAVLVVFIVAAVPLHGRFHRLVDRLAYGTGYNPEDIMRVFGNQIPAAVDLEALACLLADKVAPALLIRQSALYLLGEDGDPGFLYARGVKVSETPGTAGQIRQLLAEAGRYHPPATDVGCGLDWVRLAIPLEMRERTVGVWLFGRRDPDDYYPQDDVEFLKALASQVAVAVENDRLYDRAMEEIDERRRVEEALRESEQRLRLVVQEMPVLLDALDADNSILVWNRECERVTGYSAEEIVGNPQALELLYPDPDYLRRVLAEWDERGNDFRDWEVELTAKDGSVKTVVWSNMSGRFPIPGWASWAIGVDVTGRKRAEEHAAQAERLAAMERMAGALAHEINNPLQAIESSLGLVLDSPLGEEERWSYLRDVRREVERLKAFTGWTLDFIRPLRLKRQSTAVAATVHRALGLAGGRLRDSDIRVHVDVPDNLPPVFVSSDHLINVLLNLVLNAVDAMPEGGRLNVAARGCGEQVELTVADTGRGISPDVLPSLFGPFCTTKEGGTGMGLAVSRSIVQQYGGTITADNVPGGGAVFTVVLPQVSADTLRSCEVE